MDRHASPRWRIAYSAVGTVSVSGGSLQDFPTLPPAVRTDGEWMRNRDFPAGFRACGIARRAARERQRKSRSRPTVGACNAATPAVNRNQPSLSVGMPCDLCEPCVRIKFDLLRGTPRIRLRSKSTQSKFEIRPERGEVPEWSNGAVSKTVEPSRVPRVRIPVSPPPHLFSLLFLMHFSKI